MDIEAWLAELGLERYAQAFSDHAIDARSLPHLTADDLKELGVTAIDQRRLLLQAIAALTAADAVAPSRSAVAKTEAEPRLLTVMLVDLVGSSGSSRAASAVEALTATTLPEGRPS